MSRARRGVATGSRRRWRHRMREDQSLRSAMAIFRTMSSLLRWASEPGRRDAYADGRDVISVPMRGATSATRLPDQARGFAAPPRDGCASSVFAVR